MPSIPPHAFRYEPALCTLSEGQSLTDWRRGDEPERPVPPRRGGLRARLRAPRASARLRVSGK